MVSVVVCLALGLVLVAAAGSKAAGGAPARAALATYGIHSPRVATGRVGRVDRRRGGARDRRRGGFDGGACVPARSCSPAACAVQVAAIMLGRGGRPCACLGARGTLGSASTGRAALLATALALAPLLPRTTPTTDQWLAIGLATRAPRPRRADRRRLRARAARSACCVSRSPLAGALEVDHEGPEIGAFSALASAFELERGKIGLAVFTSEGCGMCRVLAPAVAAFGKHPSVSLRTFDEVEHADAWAAADVPGSPFAVALDSDGTVLAKGTFNTGAQLESVLAAAERRRGMVRA